MAKDEKKSAVNRYWLAAYHQAYGEGQTPTERDGVSVTVRVYDGALRLNVGSVTGVLSNTALQQRAKKRGRDTWDESDVAALTAETLGVKVELVSLSSGRPSQF